MLMYKDRVHWSPKWLSVLHQHYMYFQVEHLEVPSSQDRIYVFLHKGAMVGGKEVSLRGCKINLIYSVHKNFLSSKE